MRGRRPLLAVAVGSALVALTAGCARHTGAAPASTPGAVHTTAPSAGASQLAEMRKKVDAAASAATAADRDAASGVDR